MLDGGEISAKIEGSMHPKDGRCLTWKEIGGVLQFLKKYYMLQAGLLCRA